MDNKKLVPQIRFKGYSDEWEKNIIGNIMNVTSVKRVHQAEWKSSGVRFLRARDIVLEQQGKNILEPLFISYELYEKNSLLSGKVKINDLLVTGVGTIGVPYLIKTTEPLYFKDGNIIWFQNHCLNGTFFYYLFLSPYIQNYIKKVAGIGTVGTYTIDSGKKTPIYYPNLKEQYLIGYFQNAIDTLISKKQMKLEKIKALKQTLLKKMFPNGDSKVPEIRFKGFIENWEKKKLEDIANFLKGFGLSKNKINLNGRNNAILYGELYTTYSWNINNIVSKTNEENGVLSKKGDVLMPCSTTTSAIDLVVASSLHIDNVLLGGDISIIRPKIKISSDFLALLITYAEKKNISEYAQGTTIIHLYGKDVAKITTLIPSLEEQEKIGKYFYKLDKLISLYEKEIEKLTNLKKVFLKKMFI